MELDNETKSQLLEFADRFLNLQADIARTKEDIKALKQEYAEQGVAVQMIVKSINTIKKAKKMSDSEKSELDILVEMLSQDKTIDDKITSLI